MNNTYSAANEGMAKTAHRKMALAHYDGKKPAKVAFFLPGPQMKCVKLALKWGIIDRNTFIIAAEKHKETWKDIDAFLAKNFNRYHLHHGYTEGMGNYKGINIAELLAEFDLPTIDYAFLDFCGPLTKSRGNWIIFQLKPNLSRHAKVAFTFSTTPRTPTGKAVAEPLWDLPYENLDKLSEWMWEQNNKTLHLDDVCAEQNNWDTIAGSALMLAPEMTINKASPYQDKRYPMIVILATAIDNQQTHKPNEVNRFFGRRCLTAV